MYDLEIQYKFGSSEREQCCALLVHRLHDAIMHFFLKYRRKNKHWRLSNSERKTLLHERFEHENLETRFALIETQCQFNQKLDTTFNGIFHTLQHKTVYRIRFGDCFDGQSALFQGLANVYSLEQTFLWHWGDGFSLMWTMQRGR